MTGEGSDRPGPRSRRDWLTLAGVAAVAIVLSLIGFAVASRFEPSGGPPPPVAGDSTSTSSTQATISPPTTSTTPERTTSTTVQPQPGALALSEESVDFGEDGESVELEVIHTSGAATTWSIASGHPGVSVSPSDGELGPGESVVVSVNLDRAQIEEEGEFEANVTLSWDGGEAEARVTAVHEDNPIIHNPRATPSSVEVDGGGDCSPTRTTISARVRDTSEVEQVIVRWSPDGSGTVETPMSPIGGDVYEASIGPYSVAGTDSVKVVAFDSRDNAGGASISVTIAQCP